MFKIRKTAALAALFCSSVLNAWASADHMVIAMPQIPTIIEPQGINNNAIDRYVGNVFETLLKADQKTGTCRIVAPPLTRHGRVQAALRRQVPRRHATHGR